MTIWCVAVVRATCFPLFPRRRNGGIGTEEMVVGLYAQSEAPRSYNIVDDHMAWMRAPWSHITADHMVRMRHGLFYGSKLDC